MTAGVSPAPGAARAARGTVDVLVVGAGQAGLATVHHLRRAAPGLSVRVVDGAERVGDSWERRWDSLRLFTPRRWSALPGLPFPDGAGESPDRLEMAAYLRVYAAGLDVPVETGVHVERLARDGDGFVAATTAGPVRARQVVLATGPFRDPRVPDAAADLDPAVVQVHSYDYRRPADLPGAVTAVVGGGNSAAQLALELRTSRRVVLVTPGEPWFVPSHLLGVTSYRWMSLAGVLDADAEGRVARYVRRRGDAVFGRELVGPLRRGELDLRPSRVVGAEGRALVLADGSRLEADAVLWCTGFHAAYGWVDVEGALSAAGDPLHDRGASPVPGLHWMGLPWQSRLDSSIVHGVDADGRDTAARVVAEAARGGDH